MIAKILAKGSAAAIVGYVMREFHDKEQYTADTWRVIDSDGILGNDYRRIVDSFDIGASLNKRISKPIGHIAVSFDKADLPHLTDDFMVQLAKEYMERMGIRDTQYLIVRHLETGKPQGIRFSDGEFTFNGSKIDRAFSYKRLDKFFAKNAGIRETQPQQPAPISVTAKVKESPVANVVENIIETGCQALGGLFQVGPGYDPEEEAFIRAMKKKPKKKKGRSL
ncbi:MAG: hypothetical protein BHV69_02405 [Bacteroidales bacterium 52_46]|nr:MAG: hypothetical protein BHV69_02405 [Bacteroidales bacterium 52_46]